MKLAIVLIALACVLASAVAGEPEPGFDPKGVVRRVHELRRQASRVERGALDENEFLIDTSSTRAGAPDNQSDPALAFDGTNFLVVWEDGRYGSLDVYGARVTPAGAVLDPSGIAISTAANDQSEPALAFDGADFLVVWTDYRSGSDADDIYGARVTPAGVVLDTSGIAISTAASYQESPAIAFDGTNFHVVWQDTRSSEFEYDIYGARVTPAGVVLDTSGIAISPAGSNHYDPALAFDGANFLVVWQDSPGGLYDIYGARVTPAGVVLDPTAIAISTAAESQWYPALTFDGTNFLVVWEDSRNGELGNHDIYGARVTPAGVVLDASGIAISTGARHQRSPAPAFDGTNSLVVWEDGRNVSHDVYGARVTPAGVVLDPSGIAISTAADDQWYPALAFDGANLLVVWADGRSSATHDDICGARVAPAGVVLDPSGIAVSTANAHQWYPALAFDGTNFLVVWQDSRSGSYDIYGARVTPAGVVLDPSGIAISRVANDQCWPALAFGGTDFLVVWQDSRDGSYDIYGARVTPDGVLLDTSGIAISTAASNQESPALAFDGTNFLVAWADDGRGDTTYYDIYGARVTPAGGVLDTSGIAISTADDHQWYPALAFDGTNFLVVWRDLRSGRYDIFGTRVTPAGAVLDPSGRAISIAADYPWYPAALAFGGTNFLVVWQDSRSGRFDIYGARVTPAGGALDPTGIAISTAADDQWFPAVAFDGANFRVVWSEERNGSYDIYGARVTPDIAVFDSGPVVRQDGNQWYPALARGTGAQTLLVYQGWTGNVGGKTYGTDRIWGKLDPAIGVVEESRKSQASSRKPTPTIVRSVLQLEEVDGRQHPTYQAELLDAAGRKTLDLHAGANDLRTLAPGVYFVRSGPPAASIRKVILTR